MDYIKYLRKDIGHKKVIINCAGAVVASGDGILLQRRSDNGLWGLPGGLLELDETYDQAALREIREETGLCVRLTGFLGIFHNYNMIWSNGDMGHTIGAYFTAVIESGELRTDEESLDLRFFARHELPPLFAEDHRAAVNAFFSGRILPLIEENAPEAY